jgi:hypothetical protein
MLRMACLQVGERAENVCGANFALASDPARG